uniref:Uncharacterized protein n=1 Tax=viral metagenome TaxID=1070528 RepID=A0A6C0KDI6_9ZZZZ
MTQFVLEVLRFIGAPHGKYEHVGYMKAKFRTKKDAISYYDRHNQHMRSLNALNTYYSDWDPDTKLLYIVRVDHGVNDSVDCFYPGDNPHTTQTDNGANRTYIYLK